MSSPERDTRREIIATAEGFFRQIGYQKTTVADIAKSLRMSPANVYRFFDSKKAINEAVAERAMVELEAAVGEIAARKRPAAERLREVLLVSHRLNAARYVEHHHLHEMVACAMEESWDVVRGHIERYDAVLDALIREGVAGGEFTVAEPALATRCVRTAFVRYLHPLLMSQCAALPSPDAEAMIDFILIGLGHRPKAAA